MANKQFGVKEFTLIGSSGSPSLTSPNNLILNANTVAISTNVTVGSDLTVSNNINVSNNITSSSLNVTGVTTIATLNATTIIGSGSTSNVVTNSLNVSGVSTFAGITTVTGTTLFAKQLNVSGVSTIGAVGAAKTNLVVNGWANISGMNIVQDTDTNSIYIGYEAGQSLLDQANDNGNIALGYRSLYGSTSPDYCIAIGYEALRNPTSSTDHTIAIGYQAGYGGGGGSNVFIGHEAGESINIGHSNVAIGYEAAHVGDPHFGVYIGYDAGRSVDAHGNVFVGYAAGENVTSGAYNTFIGRVAGNDITTGSNNVIIGGYQGSENGLDIRTSSNNIVLSDGDGNIRFYANSSGNVGLGTTNPTSKLTVKGTSALENVTVSGVSTFAGITTITGQTLFAKQLNVSGVGTFIDDLVLYDSVSPVAMWDASQSRFEFNDNISIVFGNSSELQMYYLGPASQESVIASYSNRPLNIKTSPLSSGAGGAVTRLTVSNDGINVSGITTATSFRTNTTVGDGTDVGFAIKYYITANISSAYRFAGPGVLNSTDNPTLYLHRGFTYIFENSTGGSHPFAIRTSSGGSAYTSAFLSGSQTGTQIFTVPFDAPNTLVYQCTSHGGMVGTLNIVT